MDYNYLLIDCWNCRQHLFKSITEVRGFIKRRSAQRSSLLYRLSDLYSICDGHKKLGSFLIYPDGKFSYIEYSDKVVVVLKSSIKHVEQSDDLPF